MAQYKYHSLPLFLALLIISVLATTGCGGVGAAFSTLPAPSSAPTASPTPSATASPTPSPRPSPSPAPSASPSPRPSPSPAPSPLPSPSPTPTPSPGQLGVNPSSVNFGNVAVGSSLSRTASLTASVSNVRVSSASWNGLGYSVSGITFPVTVAAGKSVSFTVTFAPQTSGSSPGSVSFVSNASNSPTTETLVGTGIQPAQHSVSLSWSPSTSVVTGYNVYRGTQSGGPYTQINTSLQPGTSYSDTSVQSGLAYFYVVTAVDANSQESAYSNETTALIPAP